MYNHYYYRTGVWSKAEICILLLLLSIITIEMEYGAIMNLYTAPSIIHDCYITIEYGAKMDLYTDSSMYYLLLIRTGVWSNDGFVCCSFYWLSIIILYSR